MAFSKVGETTFLTLSGSTSQAETLPGPPATGDIVIVALASDTAFGGVAPGRIASGQGYNDIVNTADGVNDPAHQIAYKVMGGTPDTTVSIRHLGGALQTGIIQVWRGVDTGTPIDNSFNAATPGASGDPDAPSHTTVTAGALRIVVGFLDDDDSASGASAPAGYTTDFLATDTGQASTSLGCTVLIASKVAVAAGAEDPAAFVTPGSDAWAAYHFALRPAAGGGGAATLGAGIIAGPTLERRSLVA